VVERQVARWMRQMLGTIARAHVAVLADVARDHPLGQAGPSRIRVDVMVGTDARQAWMLTAASSRSARDDTTDRAEPHRWPCQGAVTFWTLVTLECTPVDIATSVIGEGGGVYSPRVLGLRSQGHVRVSLPPAFAQPAAEMRLQCQGQTMMIGVNMIAAVCGGTDGFGQLRTHQ
jgi:hypothetical protein